MFLDTCIPAGRNIAARVRAYVQQTVNNVYLTFRVACWRIRLQPFPNSPRVAA